MTVLTPNTIDASALHDGQPEAWLMLDVRTPGEFRGVHIDGTRNAPLGNLRDDAGVIREQAAGKKVALICRTGKRAEEARKILAAASVEDLHVLAGGVVAWEQTGLPLIHGTEGMSLERQVRIVAGALVLIGVALGLGVHRGFLGLSAFVGAGLMFAGLTDTCGMAMILARMPWNRASASCSAES